MSRSSHPDSLPPFDEVVDRFGATVLKVCRVLVGLQDAEDAWSETFLSALRSWPTLDPQTNVEGWLVRVAQRRCIDLLRHRDRRPQVELADHDAPSRLGNPEPADPLWDQVARLPDKQRQVIALRHLAQLSYPEIAEVIGGTPAAARRAGSDAIAALRRTREEFL